MTTPALPPRRSRRSTIIMAVVGLVVMVVVFAFLFPQLGTYEEAFAQLASIPAPWIAALVVAGVVNIGVYPLTAIAAIPHLRYRYAFVDRQVGFLISNVIPGGGAIAVGTQYSILSRYGVSAAAAAAAVSADAIWTYLMVLGAPALAVALLVIEGRSAAGYTTAAVVGLVVVVVSVVAIAAVLRSADSARRIGVRLQAPANTVWRLLHRTPPDVSGRLVEFNTEASAMVAERWRSLTLANVAAQIDPVPRARLRPGRAGCVPRSADVGGGVRRLLDRAAADELPHHAGRPRHRRRRPRAAASAVRRDPSIAIAADLVWRLVWFLPQLVAGLAALGVFSWGRRRKADTA